MALKSFVQAKQGRPACAAAPARTQIRSRRAVTVLAQAQEVSVSRRQLIDAAALGVVALAASPLASVAAKAPGGFSILEDLNDGYSFYYPFGWQEVTVKGVDVVYKDVIEALESVSVTISATDRKSILEFGDLEPVCETLAKDVLAAPGTQVKVVSSTKRDDKEGHSYYEVEFVVDNGRYTRHQLAVVAANKGKFYTLTTGSSERRWGKMKEKLMGTIHSFTVL